MNEGGRSNLVGCGETLGEPGCVCPHLKNLQIQIMVMVDDDDGGGYND